jgi:Protein of unknown function (DUF4446)
MSIPILNLLVYILAGVVVLLLIWVAVTEHRIKKFFAGTKAKNLEDVMIQINKQLGDLKATQIEINHHLVTVDQRLSKSIRNVESIRFNPFEDAGGNQSFALAFLNDEGDGVVMSSLYARDRMSVFAKKIVGGKSEFELSNEEKIVIEKSL